MRVGEGEADKVPLTDIKIEMAKLEISKLHPISE